MCSVRRGLVAIDALSCDLLDRVSLAAAHQLVGVEFGPRWAATGDEAGGERGYGGVVDGYPAGEGVEDQGRLGVALCQPPQLQAADVQDR